MKGMIDSMNWVNRLNKAICYIEQHLTEKLNYEKIADIAGCPIYYFQKLFLYMSNITLNEYIRLRRLSLAAVELQKTNAKVIDVALKYGYNSPTAFNRAFKQFHGVAPSAVKQGNTAFNSYPPLKFSMYMRGGEKLNFRIEDKKAFRILGMSFPLNKDLEKNFQNVPDMWNKAVEDGKLHELTLMNDITPIGLLGATIHHTKEWRYFIAVSSTITNSDYEEYNVPACLWAVFSGSGTNISLQDLERRVIVDWLPTSGYQCTDVPDIEMYIKADPQNAIYEYWLPIK